MILEDLQKQNEELEVKKQFSTYYLFSVSETLSKQAVCYHPSVVCLSITR